MKDLDLLRLEQVEDLVRFFRPLLTSQPPRTGWVRAIREALGITNVQLAKRLNKRPQTIEDMQKYEAHGTIKLQTLRELADALGCRLVYAIVPPKPLAEMRRDRALTLARYQMENVSHTMKLEAQGVSPAEEEKELQRLMTKLLMGNPKHLWD